MRDFEMGQFTTHEDRSVPELGPVVSGGHEEIARDRQAADDGDH